MTARSAGARPWYPVTAVSLPRGELSGGHGPRTMATSHQGGVAMLLQRTLLVNGIATAGTGLLALFSAPWLAVTIGLTSPALLAIVGAGLVAFAVVLLVLAWRPRIDRRAAWAIAAADSAWVVGSVALVEAGLLTTIGNVLVAAVAVVVLIFA